MTKYRYIARQDDLETRGIIVALSKSEAYQHLINQGFEHIRVRAAGGGPRAFFRRLVSAGAA